MKWRDKYPWLSDGENVLLKVSVALGGLLLGLTLGKILQVLLS